VSEGWTINSDDAYRNCVQHLWERYQKKKFVRIEIFDTARTLKQNDMSFELYVTIANSLYGGDTATARRECKLMYGVPILRRDSEAFRLQYDKVIKPHDMATKLEIMEWLPVTSLMDRTQFKEYVDVVMNTYAQRNVDFSYLDKPKRNAK